MPRFRCGMPRCVIPFIHVHQDGIALVERNVDQRFRKALMDGVPVPLRGKMQRALAAIPNPAKDLPHTRRYFGGELQAIADRVKPLGDKLDEYMAAYLDLPGLRDWMIMTGFTNHYEMMKVFNEWALMKRESSH